MKIRSVALRLTCWSAFCWLGMTQMCPTVHAAKPDFVGSLHLAIDEEGAKLLGLSDETRRELTALVAKREAAGEQLLADPNLSKSDRTERVARWVQESEQLGYALLTMDQREKLIQLLLARQGMVTLARADVRKILVLTKTQLREIDELLEERQSTIENLPPLRKQIAIGSYERKLQSKLTPLQLTKWERMAGFGNLTADDEVKNSAVLLAGDQPNEAATTPPDRDKVGLRFSFERAAWRDVIDWLAEEADLSLYVGSMPTGSLTYIDTREYTLDQTIATINRFLLPLGYTLIRSGRMLSVIGLEDSRRDQLLESLAEYADLADLDRRDDNEVVKCIFTIAKIDPKAALEEIRGLVKLSTPLLMPKSKQLVIIETAAKLRIVRDTLQALENPDSDAGPVRHFYLNHVSADDVLAAVRPLVGIADESTNVGQEINLSASADGKQIFATGSADKLAVIESIIQMLDETPEERGESNTPILQAHPVKGGNLQSIDDVLQTLLIDDDVRLAQDPKTGSLIVLATEDIHRRVKETIDELQGEAAVFEVIQLKKVEAYVAMSLIREMLDIPYYTDDEDGKQDYPRIDWDTPSGQIFVRGTRSQIDEVIKIIERLEQPRESTKNSTLRLLPIQGTRAQQLLETGKRFWPGNEDVLIFPPSSETPGDIIEREINDGIPKPARPAPLDRSPTERLDRAQQSKHTIFVKTENDERQDSEDTDPTNQPIKAQVTPRGILLQSNNIQLLNKFEEHLRAIAGPNAFSETRMAIFYLKHVAADVAKSLLSDLRRGDSPYQRDSSMDDSETEDDLAGPRRPRRYFSFLGPSVIADIRLNRLIVQGTMAEIVQIENHLKIIDRDKSIAEIQVRGTSHVVELVHIRASEAATIIRETYGTELAGSASANKQPTPEQQQKLLQQQLKQLQQQEQQQPERPGTVPNGLSQARNTQQNTRRDGGDRNQQAAQPSSTGQSSQGQRTRTQAPTMSMAVNETNNSLIIRAPEQLFQEVSELIQLIDKNATQATQIISIGSLNLAALRRALQGGSRGSRARFDPNSNLDTKTQPAAVQTLIFPSGR